jgi:hypothetical protein
MTVLDLATHLARDILDDIANEIRQDPALRRRVTDRLRDELSAIEGRLLSEICSTAAEALTAADADTTPDDPALSNPNPNKGGGHESE